MYLYDMQANSGFNVLKMLGSPALRRKALASSFLQLSGTFLPLLLAFGQVQNHIEMIMIKVNMLLGDILGYNMVTNYLQICMDAAVFMLFVVFRYYQQQQQQHDQQHSEEWIEEESREGTVKVKN